MGAGADDAARQRAAMNAAIIRQAGRERNMIVEYLREKRRSVLWIAARQKLAPLIKSKVRIIDAAPLQCGDDAVEFLDSGNRPDAHSIQPAARDLIVAHEHGAITAAAQFLRQPFRVLRIAERAGLHEK